MVNILGISAFYHDSAAALIINGAIVAAAQEERFSRKKHDPRYPKNAINFVLAKNNITLKDIDYIVFYDKPFLKFERLLETYVGYAPNGFNSFIKAMPIWLREKLFLKPVLIKKIQETYKNFDSSKLLFGEHHYSHAASAFYPSPFEEAVVLTLDGVGEWATTTVALGKGNTLEIKKELHFPHSLGLLYSAFTYYAGFKVNSGEYKLMGLAPYGKPIFKDLIFNNIVDLKDDGSFRINQDYFNYASGLEMTNKNFEKLFNRNRRNPVDEDLDFFHMNIAASIQAVTEEIVIKITESISKEYNIENLCMAGGVALNCVANGKILKNSNFKNIWIQPAAGDAGGALGAALNVWHGELNNKRLIKDDDSMSGSYLGPSFSEKEIKDHLKKVGANFELLKEDFLINKVVKDITIGKAVGWFQGKAEFGPRALGNRSIIADPRNEDMQKNLNLKVKFRESFRPFAPAILFEDIDKWFDLEIRSPYMLLVDKVKKKHQVEISSINDELFGIDKLNIKRSSIPAVTHVDYSARIQSVHKETNPIFHKLINEFKNLTGCPILVNTSFNVRGEPIVNTPIDAFNCFMGTNLDTLVIGNFYLNKENQDKGLILNYKNKYELD